MKLFILLIVFPLLTHAYSGKINHVRGDVTITSQGKTTKAQTDSILNSGDVLKTAAKAVVLLTMEDAVVLKLNEKSELAIPEKETHVVNLNSGSIFSKVEKNTKRQFKINTPSVVIGVRGTQFFTSYGQSESKKSDVWMCVNEGSVEVTSTAGKKQVIVNQGEGVVIPAGKDVTAPKKYAWTKKLNWNLDPNAGEIVNDVQIKYDNLLKEDYD
ncbi:hypothetical protein CIK05_00405 [Bdellovibrio sp. qaytius]|nr:hypothetical protein CIK05_00405 [Bdellovibrio sp. qaytius]